MKRSIILFAAAAALAACTPGQYDSYLNIMSLDSVTHITLNPNSPVLINDGYAELKFLVKAYMDVEYERTIEVIIDDENVLLEQVDQTTALVLEDRLADAEFTIYSSLGEEFTDLTYTTTTKEKEIYFYCTLNDLVSPVCTVRIVDKPAPYTDEIDVPVIFHLIATDSNIGEANAIGTELLHSYLERTTNAFRARLYPSAPTTVDSGINFIPATHDPEGNLLEEPGIKRYHFEKLSDYSNNRPNYRWDPAEYLNVFLYANYTASVSGPKSIKKGKELLGFSSIVEIDEGDEIYYGTTDSDWGIKLELSEIRQLTDYSKTFYNHFAYYVGLYYGLISTRHVSSTTWNTYGDADYCSDTYTYRAASGVQGIEKNTYVPSADKETQTIYYRSYNVMDPVSTAAALTPEQVARVRFVMENCPDRSAGWPK